MENDETQQEIVELPYGERLTARTSCDYTTLQPKDSKPAIAFIKDINNAKVIGIRGYFWDGGDYSTDYPYVAFTLDGGPEILIHSRRISGDNPYCTESVAIDLDLIRNARVVEAIKAAVGGGERLFSPSPRRKKPKTKSQSAKPTMKVGKYKGRLCSKIQQEDPSYYDWYCRNVL